MRKPKKRVLITSALPYINGIKHLGNLVGSMLTADVFARFQRARGAETLFICATDEHGSTTELAASRQERMWSPSAPSNMRRRRTSANDSGSHGIILAARRTGP